MTTQNKKRFVNFRLSFRHRPDENFFVRRRYNSQFVIFSSKTQSFRSLFAVVPGSSQSRRFLLDFKIGKLWQIENGRRRTRKSAK
jgi:hypothetical protein